MILFEILSAYLQRLAVSARPLIFAPSREPAPAPYWHCFATHSTWWEFASEAPKILLSCQVRRLFFWIQRTWLLLAFALAAAFYVSTCPTCSTSVGSALRMQAIVALLALLLFNSAVTYTCKLTARLGSANATLHHFATNALEFGQLLYGGRQFCGVHRDRVLPAPAFVHAGDIPALWTGLAVNARALRA